MKNYQKILVILGPALLLGWTWSILGRAEYNYNHNFGTVAGVSLFPFTLFPLGLVAMYFIFYFLGIKFLKLKSFLAQFLTFSFAYMFLLLVAETVAYYWFDVHNIGTAQYPGLPVCNCLHAPHWMKTIYLTMGPVYFLIIKILELVLVPRLEKKSK